jgi:hypothetical protein
VANTLLPDNALATMGAGLPSAMMASMLCPERRMLAVCGDGGLMMNSREMETAAPLGLNLVVLILQDNAYGMIRWKQAGTSPVIRTCLWSAQGPGILTARNGAWFPSAVKRLLAREATLFRLGLRILEN